MKDRTPTTTTSTSLDDTATATATAINNDIVNNNNNNSDDHDVECGGGYTSSNMDHDVQSSTTFGKNGLLTTTNDTTIKTTIDDNDDDHPHDHPHHPYHHVTKTKPFVYVVAATAAIGSIIFGFSLTGAGGTFVMTGFQDHFGDSDGDISSQEESLITSLQSVGSILGAIINSIPIDTIGRKYTIAIAAFVFAIGASIQCSAPIITALYIGRLVAGFGIGMLAMTVPLYIAECSPSHKRGQLTTFWQVGVTIGMLLGQGVNVAVSNLDYGWRFSYGTPIILAIVLMIAMTTYMPESPRYLATKTKNDDNNTDTDVDNNTSNDTKHQQQLTKTLYRLRYEEDVQHSLEAIDAEVEEERKLGVASWREVFRQSDKMRYRVFLGVSMQFLNQLSGNETINFYAPTIFEDIFPNGDASLISSFGLGVVNFVAVIVALFLVDRVGRVPLWIIGGSMMLMTQILNSILQSLPPSDAVNITFMISLCVFTFSYHGTMGPLAWDICAEMFPARERGKAVGLTTMSNFLGVVIIGAVFPFMIDSSPSGTYALFSVCLLINILLVYFYLPETAEKSPSQVDKDFHTHRPKLIRNIFMKHNDE